MEVYADAVAVRLSLNGKTVATKLVKKYKTQFKLPYEPGTLLAEALDANGKIISKYSLSSANAEIVLHVSAEKKVLKANGKDLCYIPIEFSDADGNLKPYIEQRVEIEVKGSATLAGFGSALCKTDEVFYKNYHDSYRGRCLAVIRAGKIPGKTVINVKSAGVKPVSLEVEVV